MDVPVPDQSQTDRLLANANSILEWVGSKADDAQNFVAKEAPLVAQEIVNWRLLINLVPAIALALLFVVALVFLPKFIKGYKAATKYETDGWIAGIVFSSLVMLGTAAGVCACSTYALKSVYAPRLVIIDYISEVVHPGK